MLRRQRTLWLQQRGWICPIVIVTEQSIDLAPNRFGIELGVADVYGDGVWSSMSSCLQRLLCCACQLYLFQAHITSPAWISRFWGPSQIQFWRRSLNCLRPLASLEKFTLLLPSKRLLWPSIPQSSPSFDQAPSCTRKVLGSTATGRPPRVPFNASVSADLESSKVSATQRAHRAAQPSFDELEANLLANWCPIPHFYQSSVWTAPLQSFCNGIKVGCKIDKT